jgi:hypothetical protein
MFALPGWLRRWQRPRDETRTAAPPVASAEAPDRRRALRRCGEPVEVHLDDGASDKPALGLLRNRSAGGLGISCQHPVSPGTLLNVRATVAPASAAWAPLVVRACTPFATGWMLHTEFVGAPSEEAAPVSMSRLRRRSQLRSAYSPAAPRRVQSVGQPVQGQVEPAVGPPARRKPACGPLMRSRGHGGGLTAVRRGLHFRRRARWARCSVREAAGTHPGGRPLPRALSLLARS